MRHGSVSDPVSLRAAMSGITHIIHCAGCTKALRTSEFYEINHIGTRNVVEAANAQPGQMRRLVHISSLAAAGPGELACPVREDTLPRPVSEYGRSKLEGEREVRNHCRFEHVILRPSAVYGPRDTGFLPLFKTVKCHLLPTPNRKQALSLIYVRDLAEAAMVCLELPAAAGKTYFVASEEVITARGMADEIASQMKIWAMPFPLPLVFLWQLCLAREIIARFTGKANILGLQKFAELKAPGWVCDASLLRREIGCECRTNLKAGIAGTLSWYRKAGWL